ncbi:MAG TPA: hypothetical protein PK611_07100 [Saprospiraceae bacterium]|nr:hypothetical protein [Saprospiraceae bacterium]HRO07824.1 hypothetical protein [Saprospiraceae bacterium]HRO73420.1 hypothetical protein [Saprospiraceae bacterium]HRP41222.1 hypothetical protein [Saprospiraceae bacterium]
MKKFKLVLWVGLLCIMTNTITAQDDSVINPPLTIEPFFGNRALAYQMIINKKLQSHSRLGFLGISNFQAEWKNHEVADFSHQGYINYSLGHGFDINAGFIWIPFDGIRPSAGFLYTYANPDLLIIANPRSDLAKNPNADMLLLAEYRPNLNDKTKLYTRAQGLYGYNFSLKGHTRSYLMLRAGITFNDVTIGLANDFDYFGPEKLRLNNFGGFVMVDLF